MRGRKMESRKCLLLETSVRLLLHLQLRRLHGIGISAPMVVHLLMLLLPTHHRPVLLQRGRIGIVLGETRPLLVLVQILERKHGLALGSSMLRELCLGELLLRVVGHTGRVRVGEVRVIQ